MDIRSIVERSDTRAGRAFDLVIQGLILVSLVSFCLETLPHLSPEARTALWWVEVVTVALFTLEYVLRVLVARPKRSYVFSFFGLVDLLAILPFYLHLGMDLRAIRVLRVFRLMRTLKLVRYNRALDRFRRAFVAVREELVIYLGATLLLMFVVSVGMYYAENEAQPEAFASVFHAMWWAVVTMTTVGYGDVVPVTPAGRVLTFLVLVLGLGVVAIPSAVLASALTRVREEEAEAQETSPAPPTSREAADPEAASRDAQSREVPRP